MNHWFKYSIVHIYFELKCARKFVFSSIRFYLLRLVQIITRNYVTICKPEIETKKLDLDKNEKKREGTWKKKETIETIPSCFTRFSMFLSLDEKKPQHFNAQFVRTIWIKSKFENEKNAIGKIPRKVNRLCNLRERERESYYYKPSGYSEFQLSVTCKTYRQFTCHQTNWQLAFNNAKFSCVLLSWS